MSQIDPYTCQRCGKFYLYLDLMGNPMCECGSEYFWPVVCILREFNKTIDMGV
jgi:hypothetical protein